MNSHDLTVAGYVAVLAALALLQVFALRSPGHVPPIGEVLTRAMRSRTGRVGILVAWAWVGLHFFAR
jgi:hypothetical protein